MKPAGKPLVWLRGEIKTPPFSSTARLEAGYLLRRLQQGDVLSMPRSRPMPAIGQRCHELRIKDIDSVAKTTRRTPVRVVEDSRRRLRLYDTIE